ncbi:TetR family transcriptional regulator [Actinosynnema sp. ALI-1.44]|uniref:TetR/AcrR family transcriptional regulator n=1 Tax=Actinosynnema sp. ALI-1.44 TaxID=1933779 RepID=UPI00097C1504|nr:TetR/AcrR family transcriptional regulator [Actinosynnema sp. ALI-1.44]ONI85859.1 TetR family transcriptional regulator [Actinosynnema sp. ALI-1.44]
MPRPKTHDDALRVRLLDRAGELLSGEGPDALSLRRLAADVGTSTTAVYSLFGGKPALVRELYVDAFHRFGSRLTQVSLSGDPAEDLVQLGLAYRRAALAEPHLYLIMFTKAVAGFEPDNETAAHVLGPMVEVGRLAGLPDPETAAMTVWGLVHGLVSLELNGNLTDAGHVERVLRAGLAGFSISVAMQRTASPYA